MSTLVVLLPERPGAPAFGWRLLGREGELLREGEDSPADLPPAEHCVLLLPERAVAWQRLTLPAAARKRWRAAVAGALEEQLLDEPEALHFAAWPGTDWIAVTARAPLQQALAALEADGQRLVERVLPRSWPQPEAQAHALSHEGGLVLRLAGPEGLAWLPLAGGYARERLALAGTPALSADADALLAAEAALGRRPEVRSEAEQLRAALAAPIDLRQGELAPQLHGLRAARQLLQQLGQPPWRAARWAALGLVVVGLVGLNALAWQARSQIQAREQQIARSLSTAFPQLRAVLEPRLQLQRELQSLRAQAGALGERDFESLLAALAAAWPEGRAPLEALSYDGSQLSLPAAGWQDAEIDALRGRLAAEGWQLTAQAGRLTLRRAERQP